MDEKKLYFTNILPSYLNLCGYVLIFIVCLFSFFFLDTFKIGVVLFFACSTVITIEMLRKIYHQPIDFLSPLSVFIVMSFLAFSLKFLLYSFYPNDMFFYGYTYNLSWSKYDYYYCYFVFFSGYIAFIAGYASPLLNVKKRVCFSIETVRNITIPKPWILFFLCILILCLDFYIKCKFSIGLLLIKPSIEIGFKIVGFTRFFFLCSKIFLLTLYVYVSFEKKCRFHILTSIILIIIMIVLEGIALSKMGVMYAAFILASTFLLLKEKNIVFPRLSFILIIGFILLTIIIIPAINAYRYLPMIVEQKVMLLDIVSLYQNFVDIIKNESLSLKKLFERIAGFDYLFPITIYGKNHYLLSFWDIFNPIKGGYFYKCDILGLDPRINIGFSHTLWGFFYLRFKMFGVIFCMFLWGKINRFIFEIFKKHCLHKDVFAIAFWSSYLPCFYFSTFDGNLIYFGIKWFIGIVFAFFFWEKILSIRWR